MNKYQFNLSITSPNPIPIQMVVTQLLAEAIRIQRGGLLNEKTESQAVRQDTRPLVLTSAE